MKRARIGVIAAAILAVATIAWAQKPDFSGTWQLDPEQSQMGGGGRGGGGMAQMTVKQTAEMLTVERQGRGGTVSTTYKLDGSESVNTVTGRGGESMEQRSTAKWDGAKLVVVTKTGETESTQTWSLANGMLTIERTGGRGPSKAVYKKTT
ncbi:MAG TPA: hypothetical protein VLD67_03945 [Vicinamibacterales bacterium]|nr:hypothetical protein [Vicinamibacterales bacterium]